MPGVQPLVFLGEVDDQIGGKALAFQDTVSYVRFGSRLSASQGIDEMEVCFIPYEEVGSNVLTIEQAASQVAAAAQRAIALGHPVLPVLREAWR
ncbi:hypothetical protein QUA20_31335 [Microcoleus sp. Pol7_A1]|uniref:hypothetical protein n=1 Tax=Microcoleus sp. Pol7_A1 TaxID=2818893 RepID=UPI002FD10FA5